MARKEINIQDELLNRKTFSIPSVQEEFGVGYKELRTCVSEMEKNGQAKLADDGLNYIVDNTKRVTRQSNKNKESTYAQHGLRPSIETPKWDDEEDDDENPFEDTIARRRRELMERLAKLSEDDDEDDEESDECKSEGDCALADEIARLREYASEASCCKLIECINYAEEMLNAQNIAYRFDRVGYKLTIKAIQYGVSSTGYIFDFPLQEKDINDLNNFVDDIKSVFNTDKVTIVAPWSNDTVYIMVQHNAVFDLFCKRALKYWIIRNGGRANIASLQRGLNIGFNRAGKIMEHLQKIGCVEQLSPSDDIYKPLHVKINLQEINALFPRFLGWD